MILDEQNTFQIRCDSYSDGDRELDDDLALHQVEDEFYENDELPQLDVAEDFLDAHDVVNEIEQRDLEVLTAKPSISEMPANVSQPSDDVPQVEETPEPQKIVRSDELTGMYYERSDTSNQKQQDAASAEDLQEIVTEIAVDNTQEAIIKKNLDVIWSHFHGNPNPGVALMALEALASKIRQDMNISKQVGKGT